MKLLKLYMTSVLVMAFFLADIPAFSQHIKGNGNMQTQTRKVSGFTGIKVSGGFVVEIKQGNQEALQIEADENLMEVITTEVKNGVLHIYTNHRGGISTRNGMKAYVTIKELDRINISGGVKVTGSSTFKASEFELGMSGGSKVSLALDVKKLDMDMSGASKVNLTGRADEVEMNMSGASNVEAQQLAAKRVKVVASGASKVKVNAKENLDINASGASHVMYAGTPNINAETSAATKISKL